jgi:hypothetical protein
MLIVDMMCWNNFLDDIYERIRQNRTKVEKITTIMKPEEAAEKTEDIQKRTRQSI